MNVGAIAKRAAIAAGAFWALAGTTTAGAWYQLFRRPLPRTKGLLRLGGVEGRIEISRDRWAVPHIRAETSHDLWFGQGFCHGQDRLWQIDFYRRAGAGRLSEIAGGETLATDRFMRTLGLRRAALAEVEDLDQEARASLEAYCAGVNAAARDRTLPVEFQLLRQRFVPFTPADALAMAKLLSFGLSTNWERELLRAEMTRELGPELAARLDPGYPAGNPVVLTPGAGWSGDGLDLAEQIAKVRGFLGLAVEATGSNNWAVSGERSATGTPLVAGDPHLPPSMPGITYQVGLYLGDRFCRGGSLPGLPGVSFGQNNDVAWTFTNVMADVMDLFIERIEGDEYELDGERRPLEKITEEIAVKGQPHPERLVVRRTVHGPIVNDPLRADRAEPLALRFSALDLPGLTAANFRVLDFASGPDMVDQLADHCHPVSNLVWADRHGSIGYKTVGRIPLRRGDSPDLPKPGWTGDYDWAGWVPYEEMPRADDPESGFLVTANNRIEPEDFAHHISSDYLDGFRARRIEQLITSRAEHDLESFESIQTDMHSIPGVETVHRLVRLQPRDQRELSAIERLRSWDGGMYADSIPATIYQAFTLRLGREVARAAIGDRDLAERWLDRADNGFIAHVTSPWRWQSHLLGLWDEGDDDLIGRPWDNLVLDALRAAMDDLEGRLGPDQEAWRWGRVHPLVFPHALGAANPVFARIFNRRLEVGGAQETVAQVGWDPNDPFTAIWAPCWRMVADPARPERSRWQAFTGQSGHPGSRHYDDLQADWKEGRTQPMAGEGPWRTLILDLPGG
ncbi:MAG: penicillin acylase family protein [Solirubrobacterales bacterium]